VNVDDIDLEILEQLRGDGRKGYHDIAAATGFTAADVELRVSALRESGLLTIVGFLNVRKLGFTEIHYHVAVDGEALPAVVAKLAASPHVRYAARVSGPRPLYLNCLFSDPAEVAEFESGLLAAATGGAQADKHTVDEVYVASYDYSLMKEKGDRGPRQEAR
jgi:DNA-binding Lrp family transcriptional regulator